jgi:3'-phosphoadenosine 5'-phosphosulfate sulfotransferase (PAPS reductase)/FAD synthetase
MNNIQHVVSVSGGKDSDCCYLLALESGREFRAVMADVGNEHPDTYEHVARLHERTGGPKVEIVRANFDTEIMAKRMFIANDRRIGRDYSRPGSVTYGRNRRWTNKAKRRALAALYPSGNPYLDMCMWKGRFPSSQAQFCTEELKVLPITQQVILPMLKAGPVLQWLGMRAEESPRRALQPKFNRHESGSMLWRPIQAWTLADVWAMHKRHGLLPNPLYAKGASRVGCWPCVNCGKNEVRLMATISPYEVERLAEWELKVGQCSKWGFGTFFAPKVKGVPIGIREVVEWSKTSRGGRQYGMFFDQQTGGGCTSDLGLCERAK